MGFKTRPTAAQRPGSHDGFTVVELVISVGILLLVLTSLYPLLQVTTAMSVKAKGTTALTNAIATEAERLRDLPFGAISASALTPRTITVDGFTITLTEVVTDLTGLGGDGTKRVAITGSTGGTGGVPALSTTVTLALRNMSSIVIPPGSVTSSSSPQIEFGSASPTEYSVLHDSLSGYAPYSALTIDAVASVPGGEIAEIAFFVDGVQGQTLLQDSQYSSANTALITYSSPRPSTTPYSFSWHTGQVDKNWPYDRVVQNGLRHVTLRLKDSMGNQATASRWYLVDNQSTLPDVIPASDLTTVLRKNTDMTQDLLMNWTRPVGYWLDGTYPVPNFQNRVYRAPTYSAILTDWDESNLDTPNTSRVATSVAPFSLYTWAVRGESALGWHDISGPLRGRTQAGYTLTSPVVGGTYTGTYSMGSGFKVTSSVTSLVTLTGPTYPATVTKVEVLRGTAAVANPLPTQFTWGTAWTDVTAAAKTAWTTSPTYTYTYSDTYTNTATKNDVYPGYKFRITLTPSGPASGMGQQVVTSSMVYVPRMTAAVPSATNLGRLWP